MKCPENTFCSADGGEDSPCVPTEPTTPACTQPNKGCVNFGCAAAAPAVVAVVAAPALGALLRVLLLLVVLALAVVSACACDSCIQHERPL